MASVGSLSDSELRRKLAEYGYPVGPVTETSRNVLVKKLKHLMVQHGRSNEASTSDKWRRKSVRFSSGEEESENEDIKSRLSSAMPPPSSNYRSVKGRIPTPSRSLRNPRKDINLRNDLYMPRTSTPDKETNTHKRSRFYVPPVSVGNLGARWSSSQSPPPRDVYKDGFDTGSDSDIDSNKIQSNVRHSYSGGEHEDSVKYRPKSTFLSRLAKIRSKEKSDDSGGGSSSVNTLLGYRKSLPSTSTANAPDNRYPTRSSSTPFQSNFYKRLSGWTAMPSSEGSAPSSIYDVKENDDVEISPNGVFAPSRWGTPHAEFLREFKTTEDEGRFSCNYQVVSMVLLVVAAAFFAILAIIYVSVTSRDSVNFGLEAEGNRFPVCIPEGIAENVDHEICVDQHEVIPAVKMIKILHPELLKRSISYQCSDYSAPIMTHQDAIKYLLKKDRPGTTTYLERYFRALKVLILSNPHWGISVIDIATGITGEDKSYHKNLVETGSLVVIEPGLPLLCYLKLVMFRILPLLGVIFFGFIGLFSARSATLWYLRRRERDKLDMFNLVEQIIDVLVRHQQAAPSPAPVYLPVNHVRDEIIPSTDRTRMTPLWDSAVKHIHENESRIRCDTQMHGGEEIAVWSWIPHAVYQKSPSASLDSVGPRKNTKMWQGQAFDTMTGCPNSLPCSPTPCLKIRHMFEPDMEVADNWPVRIEDAVLEKCEEQDVTAMHIYVDRSNRDGCVYLKCASQEDAGRAYRALHGWWFDSHLVTVKYLRLERYHERFPEAVDATIPLHPSNNQKLSLQWQGPLENN